MSEQITIHRPGRLNDCIEIKPVGIVGLGGAYNEYVIFGMNGPLDHHPIKTVEIKFQNGDLDVVGANGITDEALIAVVLHRLNGFQKGPFSSRENALAITNIQQGLLWLRERQRIRAERGVEGTHQV